MLRNSVTQPDGLRANFAEIRQFMVSTNRAIDGIGTGSGSTTLAGLTDVSIGSPSNGDVLTYNSGSGLWKPQTPAAGSTYFAELEIDFGTTITTNVSIDKTVSWATTSMRYSVVGYTTKSGHAITDAAIEGIQWFIEPGTGQVTVHGYSPLGSTGIYGIVIRGETSTLTP